MAVTVPLPVGDPGVIKRHTAYTSWAADWTLIRDFLSGERKIKDKREVYLPRLPGQSDEEYENYKVRAIFFPAARRTVEGLVGLVFRRKPVVELVGPQQEKLRGKLDICTIDGQSFDTFAETVVREQLRMGRYGALVDRYSSGEPYFAGYRAEEITNWRVQMHNGRRLPTQILLYETTETSALDGFGFDEAYRYRELLLNAEGQYVQKVYGQTNGLFTDVPVEEYKPVRRGSPFTQIPFVFFGTNDLSATVDQSPILDIVNLNRHHYLAAAELAYGRHYTAMPTYCVTAPQSKDEAPTYAVGPNRVWFVEPGGDAKLLEFTGAGLTYLENATADIERQMAVLGARLLIAPRSAPSESAEAIEHRERGEQSTLYSIINVAEEGLTRLLHQWIQWQDVDPTGATVKLNKDFVQRQLSYRDTLMLVRLFQAELMPRDAVIDSLIEGEITPQRMPRDKILDLLAQPEQRPTPEQKTAKV